MIDFANTRRGQIFFDATLPEIARQLKRIADALVTANEREAKRDIPDMRVVERTE